MLRKKLATKGMNQSKLMGGRCQGGRKENIKGTVLILLKGTDQVFSL
jgi:hypothetical protein